MDCYSYRTCRSGSWGVFSSYFKRKGEQVATKEDFEEELEQLKSQTQATEVIKAEIQRELSTFRDTLGRDREVAGFHRERIAEHLNIVINAYVELYAIAQIIPLRLWIYSNSDLETEGRFRSALSQLRTHFGALDCMGVLPNEVSKEFTDKDWRVLDSWNDVLAEAALRTPEFRKGHPNHRQFSNDQYNKQWMEFMDKIENLGAVIKGLSRDIVPPQ